MISITGVFLNTGKAQPGVEPIFDYKTVHYTTVTKELGINCGYCHNMEEMEAPTPMKEMTMSMVELTFKLRDKNGRTITCGFCHNGKAKYLKKARPQNAKDADEAKTGK